MKHHNKAVRLSARGFTLLIAVIFTGVVLAVAAALGALGYKQSVLASGALQSQHAFYAADTALECGLYVDQQVSPSPVAYASYTASASITLCNQTVSLTTVCYNGANCPNKWVSTARLSLDSGTRCADVTFYKPNDNVGSYIFSLGYSVPCTTVASPSQTRFSARGLEAHY